MQVEILPEPPFWRRYSVVYSFLIPSRNRPETLDETIRSILARTKNPNRVEFLIRLHVSDAASVAWACCTELPIRLVMGDDGDGYGSIGDFVNCLAAVARGQWLLPWSDRNRMVTEDWDQRLEVHDASSPLVLYATADNSPRQRIPMLSRQLYAILGHAGRTGHSDCYLDMLADLAGILRPSGIVVSGAQVRWATSRDIAATWRAYRSEETARLFDLDKVKLGACLGRTMHPRSTRDLPENP